MRILKPIFIVLILGAIVFFFYQWVVFPFFITAKAKIVHMEDPDSLLVLESGKLKRVQLIGVDAPERSPEGVRQCFDKGAKKEAADKYFRTKREVTLEKDNTAGDVDIYNRDLRYVKLVDGPLVNEALLRDGLAKVYNPENRNLKHKDAFLKAESDARAAEAGIWDRNGCNGVF